jgi:hypothetical protein
MLYVDLLIVLIAMPRTVAYFWLLIVVLVELFSCILAQWDPNHPLFGEPQWIKPRKKRTPGADERWPPWYAPECPPDLSGPCQLPPYYPYDPIRREIPNVGVVIGRSMAYKPYRYINLFLGVPYAKPPVYERRFKVGIYIRLPQFNIVRLDYCLCNSRSSRQCVIDLLL